MAQRQHSRQDPRVPVLSDETLCGDPFQRRYNGGDVADRIHQTFPRAKVLIGIREQKAMAISSYREFIFLGEPCRSRTSSAPATSP